MGKETLQVAEDSKDTLKEAQKDVKPIDPIAQKEASDTRKIAEFQSEILEDPIVFLEKIKRDPKFKAENKELIAKSVNNIRQAIFDYRKSSSNDTWNRGITGKAAVVLGNVLQGGQDLLGGGSLGPTQRILDELEK